LNNNSIPVGWHKDIADVIVSLCSRNVLPAVCTEENGTYTWIRLKVVAQLNAIYFCMLREV
jgi:hypothetical protein